jgi:hypothetical protein
MEGIYGTSLKSPHLYREKDTRIDDVSDRAAPVGILANG